jgi:anaerobic magnesium-protoporphyrin IX monomethyl ester cyclase
MKKISIIEKKNENQYTDFINSEETIDFLFLIPPVLIFEDFIAPPNNVATIVKNGKIFGSPLTDIPLGPISLSAYLKKYININFKVIDFNVELNKIEDFNYNNYYEFFIDKIKVSNDKYKPKYIGISALFTPTYDSIINLSKIAKNLYPDSFVLVGGNFPTSMYKSILEDSTYVDAICYGEGEKPLLNLLRARDRKKYIKLSKSWIDHDKLRSGLIDLEHDFIWDLDEIPMLDYDILDLDGYKLNPTNSRYEVKKKQELLEKNYSEQTVDEALHVSKKDINYAIPIMTSRGCPFKCTFCASHAAHGRDMRYYSINRVLNDVSEMISKYKIDGVVIQDDHFMGGKKRPYEIVAKIGDLNLGMIFQNALAIYALDYDFLNLLKESGVNTLVMPMESGSSRVLKEIMHKPLRLDAIPEVMKNCREIGIYTDVNIILGMPGETFEDIEDSRKFLKTIYGDWFRIFSASPIPGSDLHKQCEVENLYAISPLKANFKRSVITTSHLTSEDVQRLTYNLNIDLNFVNNSSMRLEKYDIALAAFQNVINIKPDHAIAHHYISYCYYKLGNQNLAKYHREMAIKFRNEFWDIFIEEFNIDFAKELISQ